MTTILVTGASGFVGSHAVSALLDAGHRIIALCRTAPAGERVRGRVRPDQRDGIEVRIGDVTDRDSLPAVLEGAAAVLHLAAIPRDFNGGASLRLVNTEGTRNLVVAAQGAGVRRFVLQGALGVEDDPALHYASSKAKAEQIVVESDLDWTVLKPSLLWGPGDGFFNIIAGLVRLSPGVVPVPGRGNARFQPLSVADLATVIVRVFENPVTIRRTYELGGPRYWTYKEITEEVLRGMGARRLIIPMPVPLIRLVAGAAELVRLPFPASTDQLRQLRLDNIGPLDTIPTAFGFEPTPMEGNLGYLRRRPREQLA